ncbi:MAG: hypothetical protein MR366_08810 [Succinivibrio sp.]|nr:hypothetical protein [Succinivibrio sp.]MDY4992097.1 hypothetical protein [Succinivibrio sp.]
MSESNTIELKQMKCPGCGYNITSFKPFEATVECPYCHEKSLNPFVVDKVIRQPEKIIPFNSTQDDFGNSLVSTLIDDDFVPANVFDSLSFDDVVKTYVPMYQYQGKYSSDWDGYIRKSKTKKDGKKEYYDVPVDGHAKGNFNVFASAYDGDDIPSELNTFINEVEFDRGDILPFSYDYLGLDSDKSILTYELNYDEDRAWAEIGEDKVYDLAEEEIKAKHRNVRDISVSTDYEIKNQIYLMSPFWFVYYQVKNRKYHFTMDGIESQCDYTAPQSTLYKLTYYVVPYLLFLIGLAYSNTFRIFPSAYDSLGIANLSKTSMYVLYYSLLFGPIILFILSKFAIFIMFKCKKKAKINSAKKVFPDYTYTRSYFAQKRRKRGLKLPAIVLVLYIFLVDPYVWRVTLQFIQ